MAAIITEFQFDQVQGGHPLRILDLGNGLNVALARNDAGRDQLLNVIPFTLYGKFIFADARGQPPQDRVSAVLLRADDGVFTIQRDWSNRDLRIIASDGTEFDRAKLHDLLDGIPFKRYRSVFTFSIARLAQMARTEDNRTLVRMATYLLRKSPTPPVPMARERAASIPELGSIYAGLGELSSLIQHQAKRSGNGQQADDPPVRARLSRELKKVESALADSRAKYHHLENELQETGAALSLNRTTKHLADIDQELSKLAPRQRLSDSSLPLQSSLDRIVGKIDDCKHELAELKQEYADIRRQHQQLTASRLDAKAVSQIEAMLLHEKSMVKEEEAVEQLKLQLQDAESKWEHERQIALTRAADSGRLSDDQALARVDALAARLRDAEREEQIAADRLARAEALQLSTTGMPTRSLTAQLTNPEDAVAIHEAEQQVLRLRERLGLDDQATRMEAERAELLMQVKQLYRDQLLPFPMILFMGIPFMFGVGMVIYGLFMFDTTDWQKVLIGLTISLATALVKMSLDRGSAQLLAKARSRLARVNHQLEAFTDRADAETTGALQHELEVAERRLDELQTRLGPVESTPLDVAESTSEPSLETARLQAHHAHQRTRDLRQDWQQLMAQLGLPAPLTPAHAREAIADRSWQDARLHPDSGAARKNHIQQLRNELDRRQDWLNVLGSQVRQIVTDLSVGTGSGAMNELFDALRDALRSAREKSSEKKQLTRALRRVRQKRAQLKENGRRLWEQHQKLVADATLKQERAKIDKRLDSGRTKLLQEQRERLESELEEIRQRYKLDADTALAEVDDDELEQRLQTQTDRLTKLREKLIKQSEQRGRLRAQLSSDVAPKVDSSRAVFATLQHRTDQLAEQLKETAKRAELAASAATTAARSSSQYEYLLRAGQYLADLSAGDFGRIELLETDPGLGLVNQHGHLVPLDHVDPQHFANLYFAMWLARLESYADRGYLLPAVLEDPLAATKRARKPVVAEILRELGARGLQLILVTSKRSSAEVFGQLGTPIADLSERQIVVENDAGQLAVHRDTLDHQAEPNWQETEDRRSFSPLG